MGNPFKKAKKKLKKAVKKVAKVGARATAAIVTGGLSETKLLPGAKDLIGDTLFPTSLKDLTKGLQVGTAGVAALTGNLQPAQSLLAEAQGVEPMGLGSVLGGLQGVLGTVSKFGGPAGTIAEIGSGFLSGFLPAQGPSVAMVPQSSFPQATKTMAMTPTIVAGLNIVQSILMKMGTSIGRNVSFRAAIIIIRRLMKTLGSPQAVAVALGITMSEIATLLTAQAMAGSSGRRMNVGNVKALRRAHRRIKGFHKLCGENDRLRAPRRRSSPKVINVKGRVCD